MTTREQKEKELREAMEKASKALWEAIAKRAEILEKLKEQIQGDKK